MNIKMEIQQRIRLGQAYNLAHKEYLQQGQGSITTPAYRIIDHDNQDKFKQRVMVHYNLLTELETEFNKPQQQLNLKI